MTKGYCRLKTDDDGHWYLVDEEDCERFDNMLEKSNSIEWGSDEWYDAIGEFEIAFSDNRVNPHALLIPKGAKEE